MVLEIDVNSGADKWDQLTQIEGVEYLFEFFWSGRESCFYLNLADQDGNQIATLIRMVLAVRGGLLRRFKDPRLPTGMLLCADYSGQDLDIQTPDDFGTRVVLGYLSADELA